MLQCHLLCAMKTKAEILLTVTPRSAAVRYQCFREPCFPPCSQQHYAASLSRWPQPKRYWSFWCHCQELGQVRLMNLCTDDFFCIYPLYKRSFLIVRFYLAVSRGFYLWIYRQLVGLLGRVIGPTQGLYLHTEQHNTEKRRHTSIPRAEYEPAISTFERPKTVLASGRSAIKTGCIKDKAYKLKTV
jgi:hypothetical protein